jgi:hypothetical protein
VRCLDRPLKPCTPLGITREETCFAHQLKRGIENYNVLRTMDGQVLLLEWKQVIRTRQLLSIITAFLDLMLECLFCGLDLPRGWCESTEVGDRIALVTCSRKRPSPRHKHLKLLCAGGPCLYAFRQLSLAAGSWSGNDGSWWLCVGRDRLEAR